MSSSIEEATQRTNLSMSNQMEMLIFRLTDNQSYGINVFKIIEILECPKKINRAPHSHPAVKGVIDFRGKAITVIDLSQAIGLAGKNFQRELAYLIICEYNRLMIAFVIESPESLMTRSWEDIHKPKGVNAKSLVAIAYNDENVAVMLLDIETILAEVIGLDQGIGAASLSREDLDWSSLHILLVDDSRTALVLLQSLLDNLGCKHTSTQSADQALDFLNSVELKGAPPVNMVISDIEMPGMDGFTLTRTIRKIPAFHDLKIMLHSSMSNPTNQIKAKQAGANDFVAKFDPEFLSERIADLCDLKV
jgi:two-component system, chemotaxis family, chemotaxis protein CheV